MLSVGHPIKLLKRNAPFCMQTSFLFLCLALERLPSAKVYIVLTDVTFSEPNKMGLIPDNKRGIETKTMLLDTTWTTQITSILTL